MKAKEIVSFEDVIIFGAEVNGIPFYKNTNFVIPIRVTDLGSLKKDRNWKKKIKGWDITFEGLATMIRRTRSIIYRPRRFEAATTLPVFKRSKIRVDLGDVAYALQALGTAAVKGTNTYEGVHIQTIYHLDSDGEVDAAYHII